MSLKEWGEMVRGHLDEFLRKGDGDNIEALVIQQARWPEEAWSRWFAEDALGISLDDAPGPSWEDWDGR